MDINVKSLSDLTDREVDNWRALQQSDPTLDSPFFSPDFARCVDQSGKPVFVALATEQDQCVGILPFHRASLGVGVPVGGQISDYHGIIGPLKDTIIIGEFLKACGLRAYDFNHLPASQTMFATGTFRETFSPRIELDDGFDAYFSKRSATSNKELKNSLRKYRKLGKDIGPVRFELNDKSDDAWQTMIEWKNQSYERMGVSSVLDVPWVFKALTAIRATENDYFSGMLSTLYVDEKLAAVHFGMRSHATYHWWFPTYDRNLYKYSPGLVLLVEVAKNIPEIGLTCLDMGRGDQPFKKSFSSAATPLREGSVEIGMSLAGIPRTLRKSTHRTMARFSKLDKATEFQRRAFNRLLGAVYLPK